MLEDLRADSTRTVVGVAVVVLVALVAIVLSVEGHAVPVGFTLIPVLGIALVSGPVSTAVVGLASLASFLVSYAVIPTPGWQLRFLSVAFIVALAVAGSVVRRRSERRIVRQAELLAVARDHELTAEVTQHMLERVTELSGAGSIEDVWRASVAQGRLLFGAAVGTYWHMDEGRGRLVACEPVSLLPLGYRIDTDVLIAEAGTPARETRTIWVRRDDEPADSERGRRMRESGTVAWSSTPIRVDGRTVGYLSFGWEDPAPEAGPAWLDLLDRYGDQVALAKTVVRRRDAQAEAQRLGERLQRALLPQVDVQACGADVRTLYRPGVRDLLLGGDFFDVLPLPEGGGVRFLIGDVSGHGPEAAALAATMRAAWQAMAALPALDLEDWTAGLDSVISEQAGDGSALVTLLMGTVDLHNLQLRYANAGHPPPIVLGGREPVIGPMSGPPLGVHPGSKLRTHCLPLAPDSTVLMVTDGMFEGRTAPGAPTRVGYDEFVEITGRGDARAPGYLERLADSFVIRNGGPMPDDVAAVLIALRLEDRPPVPLGAVLPPSTPPT
ncbi:MAG TPA: SpoIIE family protein phosphatase [Candidatus Nanopelagicales bacterium]|nr:SpoIIE family protein phosphatase [Candidatus Nanopelagicales bacterium]